MARKTKQGLDYFPVDVDIFDDDKFQLISAEFGLKGEAIAIRLLCLIYRNGYYYQFGVDESLLLAKRVGDGVTGSFVWEVVTGLVRRSFFDKGVFDSFQILTSKGIQRRYFEATERRKRIEIRPEYMLIDINDNINPINVDINNQNDNKSTQKRREEKKVKEKKREETNSDPPLSPFLQEKYTKFTDWISQFAPEVSKMKYPYTAQEFAVIQKMIDDQTVSWPEIQDILKSMHNSTTLHERNTAAHVTLLNWLTTRRQKNGITLNSASAQSHFKKGLAIREELRLRANGAGDAPAPGD